MSEQEEVSLKDIIKRLQEIIQYLLSKWLIIVIIGCLGGSLGLLYAYTAKAKYDASINFVLSNSSSGGGGGLLGLANQFGIDLGSDNINAFSGDNIITLMKSRRMVQKALFGKAENTSLINIYVKDGKMDEAWKALDRTKNAYPFPDNALAMTMVQDSLARSIYTNVVSGNLEVSQPDKTQSIYAVSTTSTDEKFSYYLAKYLVDSTSAFYINTKVSTAKQNLNMLQHEADSIKNILGGAITSVAAQTDATFNLNPAYQVQRSGAMQGQASATALGEAYGQVLQNLELAKITLQKETPLYQIIDEPTLPLEVQKPSKLISLIIGGLVGGILICGFLILKQLLKRLNK